MKSIFDAGLNGMPGLDMYRAQLVPCAFPHEKQMRIDSWSEEDREMYCGGEYTKGYLRLVN